MGNWRGSSLDGYQRAYGYHITTEDVLHATHEASHVLVALRFGATVQKAEIRRGGALVHKGPLVFYDLGWKPGSDLDEKRNHAFRNIAILVAPQVSRRMMDGYIAVQAYHAEFSDDADDVAKELRAGDFDSIEHRSKTRFLSSSYEVRQAAASFDYKTIHQYADDFDNLIRGLLKHSYLSGDEIRQLAPNVARERATLDRYLAELDDPSFAGYRAA